MTRIGIAGVGFMGMVHYLSYQKIAGAEVVAICDRNPERLAGDWTGIRGNFGPPGEPMDLSGVATYTDLQDLIEDPSVELVDLCLPPAAHADAAIAALSAGKHVFCEKPMALTLTDCDRMGAASRVADRGLMIGHVLPFFPEYAWALSEARSGKHGKLLGGEFHRVISDPEWLASYWDPGAVGGPLLDLHVHDAHFIRLLFGMPERVTTRGSARNGLPEYWSSLMEFEASGASVQAASGVLLQPSRPFMHGFTIRLERATLAFQFAVHRDAEGKDVGAYLYPPTLMDAQGAHAVELGDGDPMIAFQAELAHAIGVIQSGVSPDMLDQALARDAIHLCQMQAESLVAWSD